MLFGRTFMDHDCLMESHSDDYVSIYGSSADYTDDRLQLTTHLAYDATNDFYERDMVSMLRVGEWPLGNVAHGPDGGAHVLAVPDAAAHEKKRTQDGRRRRRRRNAGADAASDKKK